MICTHTYTSRSARPSEGPLELAGPFLACRGRAGPRLAARCLLSLGADVGALVLEVSGGFAGVAFPAEELEHLVGGRPGGLKHVLHEGDTPRAALVDVHPALLHQDPHRLNVPLPLAPSRAEYRRKAIRVELVGLHPRLEQQADLVLAALEAGGMHGGVPILLRDGEVRPQCNQGLHHFSIAYQYGGHQGRLPSPVLRHFVNVMPR
mmetsp:Transcript_63599/g.201133  ORF Transcript_63599/g.201133 Transcript_63599/m.201133 type:complete len:206 (-) Transcript_63599:1373-1990(-)